MHSGQRLKIALYSSLSIFFLLIASFIVQGTDLFSSKIFLLMAILGLLFLILGGYVIFLARKESGRLRRLLMITGVCAIMPLAGSMLHNLFYALGIAYPMFAFPFEVLHTAFFLIALLVAPLTFIICSIYSLILLKR